MSTENTATSVAVLPIPESVKLLAQSALAQAMTEVEVAESFDITSNEEAELAGKQLQVLARFRKDWDERRLEQTRPYDALKKAIAAEFETPITKALAAETKLRAAVLAWQTKERQRVEAEAAAQQKLLEEQRRAAEEEAQRQLQRAATLRTEEAREKAEAKAEEASARATELAVAAPVIAKAPAIKGVSERKTWKFQVTSLAELVKAANENPKLLMYLAVDEKAVGQVVKAMKENTDIPGIRAYAEAGLTVR